MLINLFFGIWLTLGVRRIFYWCQLWQQKEYRLDRLLLYFKEKGGCQSVLEYELNPFQGFRRPFFTIKSILLLSSSILFLILMELFFFWQLNWLALFVVYLIIPVIVASWVWVINIPANVAQKTTIRKARLIIRSRKKTLFVIGITGSYGKTSTKQILEHVLKSKFSVFATRESHNTLYSVATDIVHYLKPENTHAIIEYAAYKQGEIAKLGRMIPPKLVLISGIAKQHLGLFRTYENLKKAKFELIEALSSKGIALINCNDPATKYIQEMAVAKNIRYGCYADSQYKLVNPQLSNNCLNFELQDDKEKINVQTKLLGKIYLENVRGVIAVAKLLEIGLSDLAKTLASFEPTERFVRLTDGVNNSKLIEDSKSSNPKGFTAAIELAKKLSFPDKILVTSGIVDLGSESDNIHKNLGVRAAEIFQAGFYTSKVGWEAFSKGWKSIKRGNLNRLTTTSRTVDLLTRIGKNSLVLIEGRLPVRILQLLTKK